MGKVVLVFVEDELGGRRAGVRPSNRQRQGSVSSVEHAALHLVFVEVEGSQVLGLHAMVRARVAAAFGGVALLGAGDVVDRPPRTLRPSPEAIRAVADGGRWAIAMRHRAGQGRSGLSVLVVAPVPRLPSVRAGGRTFIGNG